MGKLVIERTSEWNNRMRSISLYLNDKNIGTIENGETKEFDLAPGTYRLKATIDWCGSEVVDFSLDNEEIRKLQLCGLKYGKWIMPLILLMLLFSFLADFLFNMNFYFLIKFVALPALLYLLYFITFGRDNYLRLKFTI